MEPKKLTAAERKDLEKIRMEGERGEAVRRMMVRATLMIAIRDLTFNELVEAWWEAQAKR